MSKFKVGDKVRLKLDLPANQITNYQADLLSDLSDRTISSACYDRIAQWIGERGIAVVSRVSDDDWAKDGIQYYEVKIGRYEAPFQIQENHLLHD